MAVKRILIVGVGGLGVPALWSLARGGGRQITLVDPEPVEMSNLARQVIYRPEGIGIAKVEAAARWLAQKFPEVSVERHECALDSSNAARLISSHDFVIDATDDPGTKFLINDACVLSDTSFVYGGVVGMTGQAMTIVPHKTACLRCMFETPPDEGEIQSCREAGIIGPVAGAIGAIQAAEAIRALRGHPFSLAGRILTYDAVATSRVRIAPVNPRRRCVCGAWEAETTESSAAGNWKVQRGEV